MTGRILFFWVLAFGAGASLQLWNAHLIAKGESHEVSRFMRLDRFARGYAIDEAGKGPQPNLH